MPLLIALALGTLISEDLTSISAGLLVQNGELSFAAAAAACAGGVYAGDLLLWLAGRVAGQRLLESQWIARRVDVTTLSALSRRIDSHLALVVLTSRFLPGTRLPVYLAAGIWGRRPCLFAAWSLVAVLLWTPLLVLLTATCGSTLTTPLLGKLGTVSEFILTATLLVAGLRAAAHAINLRHVNF
jgi:membrane protein DedA with SNARE-associated domain